MRSLVSICVVIGALIFIWYLAAFSLNSPWAFDKAKRAGVEISTKELILDTWSQEKAEMMLINELEEYGNHVEELVSIPLNQCQFDALVSWVYNLGPNNLKSSSMLRVLNEGKYDEVPAQMKRWNKAKGKVLAGLTRRREAEALMFEGKSWEHI